MESRLVTTWRRRLYYAVIDTNVLAEINRFGIYIDAEELDIDLPDPKDRVFYEVVMEERKTEDAYLVTGNIKHFPAKPYVVTPRQMMDIIIRNCMEIRDCKEITCEDYAGYFFTVLLEMMRMYEKEGAAAPEMEISQV